MSADVRRMIGLLLIALIIPGLIQVSNISTVNGDNSGESITIFVPAVMNGGGRLLLVNLTLIPNGSGNLIISGAERLGKDTESSAHVGYIIGLLLAGKDPFKYDAIINFEGNFASIEGPSASLGIALGFYSLSQEDIPVLLNSSVITGAISPDGLSVMVGGIKEKLEAACNYNATYFVFPLSNVMDYELSVNDKKCNVTPLSTTGIVSLYNSLRKYDQSYTVITPSYPSEFGIEMEKAAESFISKIREKNITNKNIEVLINESIRNMNEQHYYTAASLAYTAYINALNADMKNKYKTIETIDNLHEYLTDLLQEINKTRASLSSIENSFLHNSTIPLYTLEVLGASEARLWMSEIYAKEALESNDLKEALELASFATARYETAKLWYGLSGIHWNSSPNITISIFNKTMDNYYTFLYHMLSYTESLLGEINDRSLIIYFDEIKDLANRINKTENINNIFLRYGLAGELGYRLTNFLTMINMIDNKMATEYLNELWLDFGLFYAFSLKHGFAPLLPAAYAEYAVYGKFDPVTRISLLDNAISNIFPVIFYGFGGDNNYNNTTLNYGGVSRNEMALMMNAWEFVGIVSTIIVFLVTTRNRRLEIY